MKTRQEIAELMTRPPMNDLKYVPIGDQIVKRSTGEPIPEDEPVFMLRGRDILAIATIRVYLSAALAYPCTEEHCQAVERVLERFYEFRKLHRDRMKEPGITRNQPGV